MGCLVRCFLFYSFCFGLFFKNFLFLLFLTKWQFRWHEFWNEIFNQIVLLMLPICRRYCVDVTQIQQCHVWIWPWSHAKPDCHQRLCNRELFLGSTWINRIETSQVMFWNLSSLPFFFFLITLFAELDISFIHVLDLELSPEVQVGAQHPRLQPILFYSAAVFEVYPCCLPLPEPFTFWANTCWRWSCKVPLAQLDAEHWMDMWGWDPSSCSPSNCQSGIWTEAIRKTI